MAASLPSEAGRYIPTCAEECFASFLSVNYASTGCDSNLTMNCMCSRIGSTGFTLGEGAMQCISAERSVGYCSESEASDRIIEMAYDMCNGRPDAIEPTQRTITATLVLAPSGGVITFPSVTVTQPIETTEPTASNVPHQRSSSTSSSQTLPTTLVVDTSSPPPLPITRTSTKRSASKDRDVTTSSDDDDWQFVTDPVFVTEPPTTSGASTDVPTTFSTRRSSVSSSTSTTETAAATSTEAAGGAGGKSEDDKDSGKLSSEQVAGISVGVLAAAGVAAGAIVLARYYRRKNHPKAKTGFLPMRDTWGYKPEDPRNGGGHDSWMIHQMRPTLDPSVPPPPPPAYNRKSLRPSTLGLAISPAPSSRTAHSSPLRRISKLLPAKPVLPSLPLKINKEKSPPLLQPEWDDHEHHNIGSSSQENVSHMMAPPALSSAAGVGSPSRNKPTPPKLHITTSSNAGRRSSNNNRESNVTEFEEDRISSSANTNSTQVWRPPPTTPISAGTYYVADQYGNWVLGNSKRASVIARGSQGSKESQEGVPPKPPPKDDNMSSAGLARSRSLAPAAEIRPAGVPPKEKPAGPRPQYPSPFFSSQNHPRRNMTTRRSMTRNLTRPREDSSSSNVTTITTSSEEPAPVPAVAALSQEQQATLSPVVESPPRHPQPRIPPRDPRRMSQMSDYNRRSGPPTRPFAYNPPGQPSPTLGMMQAPQQQQQQQQQLNEPEVIPNVGLEKDSPSMRLVDPSPPPNEDEAFTAQPMYPSRSEVSPFYFDPPYPQPLNTMHQPINTSHSSQHRRSASGSQAQQAYRPYQRPPSNKLSSNWQAAQRLPQSYQSFQQQQPVHPHQRQQPNTSYQRQPPQGYQSFQPNPNPPYPRNSAYQSFQYQQQQQPQQPQAQHSQIHPSRVQYQTYNPSPTTSQPRSGDSTLLAKRLGSDRAANMSIGTESPKASKWRREDPNLTPPGFPLSPHWKPTLTPTRRGDDLYLNVQ
ncbi:hypothetical protein BHE90_012556 [Fusarium euwallaceae]|uniref:Extracellular membrane protein CFEM domain-containing protein n=1 Tax=Fusarium euwallaceae TaxID=1147111 RepID=A0A430LBA5_9HYPO|nr:hypothetical protein BHE90_012556 [Fusarium euwallaceae]